VQRWVRNVDIFSKSVLFIPVNQHLHWSLAVVCNPGAPALRPRRRRRSPTSTVLEEVEDEDVVIEEEEQEKKPSSSLKKACVIDLSSESEDDDEPIQRNRRKKQPAAAPEEEEAVVVEEEEEEVDPEESREDAPCILMMDSLTAHDAKYVSNYIRNFLRCAWNDRKDAPPLDGPSFLLSILDVIEDR
jgi:sentrin-specific protease 7